jgi:hypothetical protein
LQSRFNLKKAQKLPYKSKQILFLLFVPFVLMLAGKIQKFTIKIWLFSTFLTIVGMPE